ncbi:VWA domain-containing protein, partial [candidate division KSB1 bacterium]|nr:VWA domain-containing protein [candidate division KSB1 bacterium]NIR70644.1 VWA domain-containing protein [candidate division KSB1 bacterium]NIS24574.1 VWA domain-containing protein [candidate division KSB1 bacterium]NIT71487.1 VWA domain-containing protein [candidate division KSB1 bacterium]NIU25183.1 VWA domain-containing protein [candidate division KSB1 bacterium]
MLTFLNSAILFGLAAIAIPILIHLFTRQKTKVINFSSLRFLKELQKQKVRRLKLRQILLLILRALVIFALILAFSRPALKQTGSASLESGAQLTSVIILDNTLSMARESEGKRLLDQAKKRALDVVELLRPGDEIYLLYPQAPPKFAHEGPRYNRESIRQLIEDTELSYQKTDYIAAFSLASQIMNESANINKEVYLIGDMQKNALPLTNNGNAAQWFDDTVKFYSLPITPASKSENLAISNIRFGSQILEKDKVVELEAMVENHSDDVVQNKLVHLFVNGKRVGQDALNLEPQAAQSVLFRMVPDRTGQQSGYVLLEDDLLLEDNRRYFTFNIPDEIPVLLVGNRENDTYFIKLALSPDKETMSYIKFDEISPDAITQTNLDNYEVVVLSNVPKFDHVETMRIKNFVEAGGGLLVFLGADVNLRNYNENLHAKLNLPPLTEAISSSNQEQFLSLGKIDFSHPIFKNVFEDEKNVESPHFRFAIDLKTESPLDKIIEYSNGTPFLFESEFQKGRILYATTGISSEWSDLALRGIFVALINRSVSYLAGTTNQHRDEILVGEEITYYPEESSLSANLSMEKPDGSRIRIKPEVTQGKYFVRFNETDLVGIYGLYNGDQIVSKWSVNYDSRESDPTTFETDQLAEIVGTKEFYEIQENEQIAIRLKESRFGRELWKYFVVLALLLLLAEMFIYREKAEAP